MLFSIVSANAQPDSRKQRDLVPDYAAVQFAGSIGLVSAGAGYQLAKRHIETELLMGYLPESIGGDRLWTTAIKFNYIPVQWPVSKSIGFKPLQLGVMAAYTWGSDFWGLQPDRYPDGYYTFSTAWHAYFQAGSSFTFPTGQDRLGVYYEFNASAEEIVTLIQNPEFITPGRIFNLALGAKYYF